MPSSRPRRAACAMGVLFAASVSSSSARAQTAARGFGVERLYVSAPGSGWFVMDGLDWQPSLGGTLAITAGYARNPLRVRAPEGSATLPVVSSQAFTDFGFAASYDRFRLYLNFTAPIFARGTSGDAGGSTFTAPDLDLSSHPDTLSDVRIGFDARILGAPEGSFRLGAGAQLFVPNGDRADYVTDDSYRAMGRVLFAGDIDRFTYSGHLGVHVRPLDDGSTPESPRGSELLFGLGAGVRLGAWIRAAAMVGTELYGETALRSAFLGSATGVEGLVTGRLEGDAGDHVRLRGKVGVGAGLSAHFGAPEWRGLLSLEVTGRAR